MLTCATHHPHQVRHPTYNVSTLLYIHVLQSKLLYDTSVSSSVSMCDQYIAVGPVLYSTTTTTFTATYTYRHQGIHRNFTHYPLCASPVFYPLQLLFSNVISPPYPLSLGLVLLASIPLTSACHPFPHLVLPLVPFPLVLAILMPSLFSCVPDPVTFLILCSFVPLSPDLTQFPNLLTPPHHVLTPASLFSPLLHPLCSVPLVVICSPLSLAVPLPTT
ncbi:hypothetical protein Pcinc_009658 [Petrolisthes cinctipes]|uniref:Uncharacterized protein n=1 Tax=Petrolisthes cinctipes TaxID=88211 RepID=A0AAE1G6W9_PETCI|nr:hypothetical protein Pcinc_009658 [Petrolisthes cinctipes]